ncbi:PEP-CTERM sorting domain-containing protein [Rhodopirellula baltica]|uniref:PEP-CTERM sorting domain-containing protein n=1 Tax=Rhodopirellula baltica TaxID=265606 RepID=UPI001181BBC2|nr:PEP-CTERM sorting domain-containing protein [Rhodopirellula baltica]
MLRYIVTLLAILSTTHAQAALVFSENAGMTASPSGQSIASYSGYSSSLTFEGNVSQSTVITPASLQSAGYSGASGGSQFRLLQASGQSTDLIIRGIDTTPFELNSFELSFGLRKSLASGFTRPLFILATTDDVNFTIVDNPFTFSNTDWQLYTGTGLDLPSSSNLSLYISKSPGFTAPIDVFIDDIQLAGVTAVPEPSSLGLAIFGSATALLIRRQRRSRSDCGEPWVATEAAT